VSYIISPFPETILRYIDNTKQIDDNVLAIMIAIKENIFLKDQVSKLLFMKNQYEQVLRENERLCQLIRFNDQFQYDTVAGKIISHDTNNWFKSIMLNKGTVDGVNTDYPAIIFNANRAILIGRVINVDNTTSKVLLITDRLSSVPARICSSNDEGLIQGNDTPYLSLDFVLEDSVLKIGDEVITSGIGEIFPQGLFVGVVKEIKYSSDMFFKQCKVEPYFRVNSINEVLIVKPVRKSKLKLKQAVQ
jgi:rod shape-determining protein MreC